MARSVRRVAILARTLRSQEYARRVFRSFGDAPFVFESLNDLTAAASHGLKLDMLYVGGHPINIDGQDEKLLRSIRRVIGGDVPLLYAPLAPVSSKLYGELADNVLSDKEQHFIEIYTAIYLFLRRNRYEDPASTIFRRDKYSFNFLLGSVAFGDEVVSLSLLKFDIALELFYNAGSTVTEQYLRSRLPHGWARPKSTPFHQLIESLRATLSLDGNLGWNLEIVPKCAYRLSYAGDTINDSIRSRPFYGRGRLSTSHQINSTPSNPC
jgi:hypothetical protein